MGIVHGYVGIFDDRKVYFHSCLFQFYCERLDGLYDILPYFLARFVVQMPVTIMIAIVYSTPIYWMCSFQFA